MRAYKKVPGKVKEIVTSRIRTLFEEASKTDDPKLAKRYVIMARKLSTKNKVYMPRGFSRLYCRNCNAFFVPGKNVRIRTREGKQVYYCLECKHHKRFPFIRERKKSRKNKVLSSD